MARKPTKGYFVKGHFVAEGSELDLELKRELRGDTDISKTDLKKQSDAVQALGEQLLTLRLGLRDKLGLPDKLIEAVEDAKRITNFEGRRRQMQFIGKLMRKLDDDTVAAIAAAMTEPALNLCGQDTLKQLTALLSQTDLLVAPDTGPAHIASAVGTDVLGLYAASNPLRSGPYRSLNWCVNRYPEALQRFTGKTVEQARWGAKAEFPGAMDLITVEDAAAMLDRWIAAQAPR
jgi:hypothetical protein